MIECKYCDGTGGIGGGECWACQCSGVDKGYCFKCDTELSESDIFQTVHNQNICMACHRKTLEMEILITITDANGKTAQLVDKIDFVKRTHVQVFNDFADRFYNALATGGKINIETKP